MHALGGIGLFGVAQKARQLGILTTRYVYRGAAICQVFLRASSFEGGCDSVCEVFSWYLATYPTTLMTMTLAWPPSLAGGNTCRGPKLDAQMWENKQSLPPSRNVQVSSSVSVVGACPRGCVRQKPS